MARHIDVNVGLSKDKHLNKIKTDGISLGSEGGWDKAVPTNIEVVKLPNLRIVVGNTMLKLFINIATTKTGCSPEMECQTRAIEE